MNNPNHRNKKHDLKFDSIQLCPTKKKNGSARSATPILFFTWAVLVIGRYNILATSIGQNVNVYEPPKENQVSKVCVNVAGRYEPEGFHTCS